MPKAPIACTPKFKGWAGRQSHCLGSWSLPVDLSGSVDVSTTEGGMISLSTEGNWDQDTCASILQGEIQREKT